MLQILFGPSLISCTDVSQWVLMDRSLRWQKSVNQSWQASFSMQQIAANGSDLVAVLGRPQVGQVFWITETINSVRKTRFSGIITQVIEQAYPSSTHLMWKCTCGGWSVVCDHRVVTAEYDAGDTSLQVYQDIWTNTIAQDGITFADVDGFILLPQPLKFNPTTVTDAFNQLKTLGGQPWWIDENKGLHSKESDNVNSSGIVISDASGNWLNGTMQVNTTTKDYRNVEYEMTSQPVATQNRIETFTGDGATFGFVTKFPITAAPTVTVNGVTQTIYAIGVDAYGQNGYYWIPNGYGVQQGQQHAPGVGVAVVVTYDAISINYTIDQSAAQVAARAAAEGTSGKWEHIDNKASIGSALVGHAYGQGQLKNYGVIPQVVKFDTYVSGFDENLFTRVTFALTLHNLFGQYLITDVAAVEEPAMVAPSPIGAGGTIRYTVTVTNQQFIGDYVQWFQGQAAAIQTVQQSVAALAGSVQTQRQPLTPNNPKATFVLEGGPWGAGTDLTNHDTVEVAGTLSRCDCQAKDGPAGAGSPAVSTTQYFTIKKSSDGGVTWVDIFGTAPLPNITTSQGQAVSTFSQFATAPDNTVAVGDILRIDSTIPSVGSPAITPAGVTDAQIVLEWTPTTGG